MRGPARAPGRRTGAPLAGRTAAGAVLQVRDVRKTYGDRVALAGVDLDVGAGTILGLVGPNGAGKTTLVSIVAGLRRADAGAVRVAGCDVVADATRARALIGLAPQDTGVYLSLSVRDNLAYFAGLAGLRRRARRARVESVAAALGLADLLDRQAAQLSGGERRLRRLEAVSADPDANPRVARLARRADAPVRP